MLREEREPLKVFLSPPPPKKNSKSARCHFWFLAVWVFEEFLIVLDGVQRETLWEGGIPRAQPHSYAIAKGRAIGSQADNCPAVTPRRHGWVHPLTPLVSQRSPKH